MLTFAEVCDQLRVTPKTLRNIIKSGDIAAVQIGGNRAYRISEAALEDYLQRSAVTPSAS